MVFKHFVCHVTIHVSFLSQQKLQIHLSSYNRCSSIFCGLSTWLVINYFFHDLLVVAHFVCQLVQISLRTGGKALPTT